MIFELKKTRSAIIYGLILLVLIIFSLYLLNIGLGVISIFSFAYILMIFYYTKRVGIHDLVRIKNLLMIDQDVNSYLNIMLDINQLTISKDQRWIVTKRHNLILGYLYKGMFTEAGHLLSVIEKENKGVLNLLQVFDYMHQTLKTMEVILSKKDSAVLLKEFKHYNQKYHELDDKTKNNTKNNKNSFHNWVQFVESNQTKQVSDAEIIGTKDLNPMIKVLYLKSLDKDDQIKDLCKTCFTK